MTRPLFLRLAGSFHLVLGGLFFLFTKEATVMMIESPGEHMHLLVKGLSGIVAGFGGMSLLASNASSGRALNAILGGTLFYLLFTVGCDIVWVSSGLLRPAAWVSIGIRATLGVGYGYHLWIGTQRMHERNVYGKEMHAP